MKVIRTYPDLFSARQASAMLAEAGIGSDIPHSAEDAFSGDRQIRLVVDEADAERALELLGPPAAAPAMRSGHPRQKGIPWWFYAALAVALGSLVIRAASRSSLPREDVVLLDRNGDGQPDERQEFGADRRLVRSFRDDNFDSRWDVRISYSAGIVTSEERDAGFDGSFDWKVEYRHGLPLTATFQPGGEGTASVLQTFVHGVVASALLDQDRDGTWDVRVEYDPAGQETRRTPLK